MTATVAPIDERLELSPQILDYIAAVGPVYAELVSGRLGSFAGYAIDIEPDGTISMRCSYVSPAAFEAIAELCRLHFAIAPTGLDYGAVSLQPRDGLVEIYVDGKSAGSIPIPKEGAS